MPSTYKPYLKEITDWLIDSVDQEEDGRKWMIPSSITYLTSKNCAALFENNLTDLNAEYLDRKVGLTIPSSFIQQEVDLILGLSKSLQVRHKTRLDMYRDATEQRRVRIPASINLVMTKQEGMEDNFAS